MTAASSSSTPDTTAPANPTNGAALAAVPGTRSPVAPLIEAQLEQVARLLHPDEGEFVGRGFIREYIDQFFKNPNRMLVITGPPGIGKTAFAAQLVQNRLEQPYPYLAHFCQTPDGDNPIRFCENLATQLKAYLGDDYQFVALGKHLSVEQNLNINQASGNTRVVGVEIKELKLGQIPPRDAFRMLVREPLQAYHRKHGKAPGNQRLVIVIDGLDHVWQWDGGQTANIISVLEDVQDLPPWVNLICTARPGPAVQALRAQAGVHVFDINPDSAENLEDIRYFVEQCFLGTLAPEARARFDALLAAEMGDAQPSPLEAFVERVVATSEGNFSFVRRYIGAWRLALHPAAGQPEFNPAHLLRFEGLGSLDRALDATYAEIERQLRPLLDANQNDADSDVLATLAIAYEPLNLALIGRMSRWPGSPSALDDALRRLEPVLEKSSTVDGEPTFALYHRGFAEYLRRNLPRAGRDRDLLAAQALEQLDGADPQLLGYGARHRWAHLLRGLDLCIEQLEPDTEESAPFSALTLDWRNGVAQVQALAQDAATQAQLLRLLATRALDPTETDVEGSWSAALNCLRVAEQTLRSSRALQRLRRRGWRVDDEPPPEQLELERTLIALGDAYRTIAQRMDVGGRHFDDWTNTTGWAYAFWDALVRLPLSIYLLMVLIMQGVREIHIPGALQNLGRGQDWTIARLYVLSVSAYRRARELTHRRDDESLDDDVSERLGRSYTLMGAYDAAAATYDMLLSRPAAITSPWRQAIWLHSLGEVMLAQRKADRAVEVLTNALVTFQGQAAPVLQARALSSLAAAHILQAEQAGERGDDQLATQLDNRALAECGEALTAWRNVSNLKGDESASIDPELAISRIGNQLWRQSKSDRLSDEQFRTAQALRDSISERHFPQRFEHPLLRLFRVIATTLLPAMALLGLLLAVQSPSTFLANTRVELALLPPLFDFNQFTNNVLSDNPTMPVNLSEDDLMLLLASAGWRQFAPAPPELKIPTFDLLTVTALELLVVGGYLLIYLVCGLIIIALASPTRFQLRRPGRLILSRERLGWRGPLAHSIWRDSARWLKQEARLLVLTARQELGRAVGLMAGEASPNQQRAEVGVALADIKHVITLDRRERGQLLGDFSYTLIEWREAAIASAAQNGDPTPPQADALVPATSSAAPAALVTRTLYVPGTLVFYDELCDELTRRLGTRWHSFNVEILKSPTGVFFVLTLIVMTLLAGLAAVSSSLLQYRLPLIGYTLSDLYVLVIPGVLLPLLWWFVAQPLGARAIRGRAAVPLLFWSMMGGGLTAGVLFGGETLNLLGFQPDFFTPILAVGLLIALLVNAPPRPLRRAIAGWGLARSALAVLAFAGLVALSQQLGITLAWYDALVQGNVAMKQALADPTCRQGRSCPLIEQAIERYSSQICLRPGASEGYAFRGFAFIAQGQYDRAREDFQWAIDAAQATPRPQPGCQPAIPVRVSARREAGLYANLGAANLLLARTQASFIAAEPFYQEALLDYIKALSLNELVDDGAGPATAVLERAQPVSCTSLARDLLQIQSDQAGNLSEPAEALFAENQALYMRQLADTCYSRGFSRARAISEVLLTDRNAVRTAAWNDLTAAVAHYTAVSLSDLSEEDLPLVRRSMADAWLVLGQFNPLPAGAPNQRSYLIRAVRMYHSLEDRGAPDEQVYAGQAWGTILLGAWDEAHAPLAAAVSKNPQNPAYPALQGLVAWLDSTKYTVPVRSEAPIEYTRAISSAISAYSRVIDLRQGDLSRAYATRSVLYYSLRNSPRGPAYSEADFEAWTRLAIVDIDQALIQAEQRAMPLEGRVPYLYWRGRLHMTLALAQQNARQGMQDWNQLTLLYSRAIGDFSQAIEADPLQPRREKYRKDWLPLARSLHNNALHLLLAQQAVKNQEYELARSELELVTTEAGGQQTRDPQLELRPEYSYLHGLISLALNEPEDFPNPLLTETQSAEASYRQALTDTAQDTLVEPAQREPIYRAALAQLEALLQSDTLTAETRTVAERVRANLARLVEVTATP